MPRETNIDKMIEQMGIDMDEISIRKNFLEFNERDTLLLTHLHKKLLKRVVPFVDHFYSHLLKFEGTRKLLPDQDTVTRLKSTQQKYFSQLTEGSYGAEYIHDRLRVGMMHQRIGLEPKWYLGAYLMYLNVMLLECWAQLKEDPALFLDSYQAVQKIIMLDMGLAIDTYIYADQQEILYNATYDALTGLPNRMLFQDRLNQMINSAQHLHKSFALVLLNLDNFTLVNDNFGYQVGDHLMQLIAKRLSEMVPQSDTVSRLGSDEFVFICPEVRNAIEAIDTAKNILSSLSQPLLANDQEITLTGSMGIGLYPNDGADGVALLKSADAAMYHAKKQGKNNYQFYEEKINVAAQQWFVRFNELKHASDHNEFIVYYQPKINLKEKRISGFEALLRWQHPTRGIIPPDEFIPTLEEGGLICSVGEWVLQTACAQGRAWSDEGIISPMQIAVNVSAYQVYNYNLRQTIQDVLKKTGIYRRA